jgi:hypothetical protein
MARSILRFLDANTNNIPLIFIGVAHFDGIARQLPQDVGYVFLSSNNIPVSTDLELFNRMRNIYVRFDDTTGNKFRGRDMKIPVVPTALELPQYDKFISTVKSDFLSIKNQYINAGFGNIGDKIAGAIAENQHLSSKTITRGIARNLEPKYETAIAYISENHFTLYESNFTDVQAIANFFAKADFSTFGISKYKYIIDDKTGKVFKIVKDEHGGYYIFIKSGSMEIPNDSRIGHTDIEGKKDIHLITN